MNDKSEKSITFYTAVNRNGYIGMYADEPIRDDVKGIWKGIPFINSLLYKEMYQLNVNSQCSWGNEPNFFETRVSKNI